MDVGGGYSVVQVVKGSSVTDWLGAVSDFGFYHSALIGPGLSAGTDTFGPRISYRHWGRFTPFTQALLGGVRHANNGLAFGAGGGADIALDSDGRFALRPQVEYLGFRANGNTTNTVRLGGGLVFRLGKR